jgi:hypothetical protein
MLMSTRLLHAPSFGSPSFEIAKKNHGSRNPVELGLTTFPAANLQSGDSAGFVNDSKAMIYTDKNGQKRLFQPKT